MPEISLIPASKKTPVTNLRDWGHGHSGWDRTSHTRVGETEWPRRDLGCKRDLQ